MSRYVSNARTPEELRAEFISDLLRRLDVLDAQLKNARPNAAEAARIGRARRELLDAVEYWKNVELKGDPT